jgi:deferrochelatase/peroxidase EfeB
MTPQAAILEPVPDHARHLFFDLNPATDPSGALRALATACDFLAFGKSFDAYEAQLRRMTGHDDGISDALFHFTRPITGGYYWCPPLGTMGIDQALGL